MMKITAIQGTENKWQMGAQPQTRHLYHPLQGARNKVGEEVEIM